MTVAVIGGGASGLMAAITAAEHGHQVTIWERQARVGRKLLATGNGRCNLTNRNMQESCYHGTHTEFMRPAMERFGVKRTLRYFEQMGLLTVTEDSGRVYPFSDQAGSVVDVLRFRARELGVELLSGCEVNEIMRRGELFVVASDVVQRRYDRVIVCCGGAAGEKLGGTKSGYMLLRKLGHTRTELSPALVQLRTETELVRALKGVRADAKIAACLGEEKLCESAGEVQFTEYGVSGPAVFDISRAAVRGGEGVVLTLDLARHLPAETVLEHLARRREKYPNLTAEDLLTGFVHNRLGRMLVKYAGIRMNTPLPELTDGQLRDVCAAIKGLRLRVTGNMGYEGAQVTAGGIKTEEFDARTLGSKIVPGLFAAGEVLDIDGDCGGYNLQWAWSSGHLAGLLGQGEGK